MLLMPIRAERLAKMNGSETDGGILNVEKRHL